MFTELYENNRNLMILSKIAEKISKTKEGHKIRLKEKVMQSLIKKGLKWKPFML